MPDSIPDLVDAAAAQARLLRNALAGAYRRTSGRPQQSIDAAISYVTLAMDCLDDAALFAADQREDDRVAAREARAEARAAFLAGAAAADELPREQRPVA